jgi:hypothetical protein
MSIYDESNKRKETEFKSAREIAEKVFQSNGMKVRRAHGNDLTCQSWNLDSEDKASQVRTSTYIELRFPYSGYHSTGKLRLGYQRAQCTMTPRGGNHGITKLDQKNIEKWALSLVQHHHHVHTEGVNKRTWENKAKSSRKQHVEFIQRSLKVKQPTSWEPGLLQTKEGIRIKVRSDGTCSFQFDISSPDKAVNIALAIKTTLATL